MRWRSPSPEATRAIARALAAAVDERGLAVALIGPLGAGKTVFAKGLAEGLGLEPERLTSASFVIASEYPLAEAAPVRMLAHVDCYRLGSVAELEATGFADLLVPGVLVAVEWGDRFSEALPDDRLEVRFARAGASAVRILEAQARGAAAKHALDRWRAAVVGDPATAEFVMERARWR